MFGEEGSPGPSDRPTGPDPPAAVTLLLLLLDPKRKFNPPIPLFGGRDFTREGQGKLLTFPSSYFSAPIPLYQEETWRSVESRVLRSSLLLLFFCQRKHGLRRRPCPWGGLLPNCSRRRGWRGPAKVRRLCGVALIFFLPEAFRT